jgi:hypothetical protein
MIFTLAAAERRLQQLGTCSTSHGATAGCCYTFIQPSAAAAAATTTTTTNTNDKHHPCTVFLAQDL